MTRTIARTGKKLLIIVLATVLLVPTGMSAASAQPAATGPPVCSLDHPEFCADLGDQVTLLADGKWGNSQAATLSLSPTIPPCETASTGCYHRIIRPRVASCFEAVYNRDGHKFVPCAYYVVAEFDYALQSRGAVVSPEGGCRGEFDFRFVQGGLGNDPLGPWAALAPNLLDCTISWTSLRGPVYLNSPTYVSFAWGVEECLETGPRVLGSGLDCIDSEVHEEQSAWVELLGTVYDSTPVAACELSQREIGSRIIRPFDVSYTEGPNPTTNLGSRFELQEGLDWSSDGSYLVANRPGLHEVTIITEMFGWSLSDSATCAATVEPWDDDTGGQGSGEECDGKEVTVYLGSGDLATDGDDVILGTPDDDVIDGLAGDDVICAGDGNDTVQGGPGADTIFGENGNDKLFGATGADTIDGGPGDDTIHGNKGNDVLSGGTGADKIFGYANNDVISGGDGDDKLHGNFGVDVIDGGAGNDAIFGYGDEDTLRGGDGNDIVSGNRGDDVIYGDAGNDQLWGADGNDEVNGGAGDDIVNGNSLDDILNGGPGDDTLDGGINTDSCVGGQGVDTATRCETTSGVP